MATIFNDGNIVHGVCAFPIEVVKIPDGSRLVKIRQRQDECMTVFLKFPNRIEQWHVDWVERNKSVCPKYPIKSNTRP